MDSSVGLPQQGLQLQRMEDFLDSIQLSSTCPSLSWSIYSSNSPASCWSSLGLVGRWNWYAASEVHWINKYNHASHIHGFAGKIRSQAQMDPLTCARFLSSLEPVPSFLPLRLTPSSIRGYDSDIISKPQSILSFETSRIVVSSLTLLLRWRIPVWARLFED